MLVINYRVYSNNYMGNYIDIYLYIYSKANNTIRLLDLGPRTSSRKRKGNIRTTSSLDKDLVPY